MQANSKNKNKHVMFRNDLQEGICPALRLKSEFSLVSCNWSVDETNGRIFARWHIFLNKYEFPIIVGLWLVINDFIHPKLYKRQINFVHLSKWPPVRNDDKLICCSLTHFHTSPTPAEKRSA